MFKKWILAAALSLLASSAFAACTNPLVIKDGSAANISMSMTSNADGFCQYNFNMAQINGVVPLMGAGATGTGSPRVTAASDSPEVTGIGAPADAACGTATGTCSLIALQKFNNTATGSAVPAGTNLIGDVNLRQGGTALSATNGAFFNQLQANAALSATNPTFSRPTDGTNARVFDPCEIVAHVKTPISINTAATSVIVAGTASKLTHICSMMLFSAGTTNVGIVQGSGATCGTSTLGLVGGATAATGPNLTAQAGFVAGNGNFAIAGTTVNANDICLINSAAIQVSGFIVTATP